MDYRFSGRFFALCTSLVLLAGVSANAQSAADTAASAEEAKTPELYEGTAEVSSIITTGNTKNQTTGLGVDFTYRPDPWLVNLKSKYQTAVNQEVQTEERFEVSGRGGRKITDSLDTFIEHSYLKNRFAGTDNRFTTSAGFGYAWLKSDMQALRTEAALGYTHEDRTDNTKLGFMSGELGLLYKYKITATSDISHETKYKPNFQTSEDWRLSTETALSASISSFLSSKISWKYEHVNLPPVGKVKGDTTTTVSLLAKF